jgi:hypothetical protein
VGALRPIALPLAICSLLAIAGCGSDDDKPKTTETPVVASDLPQGSEPVDLDPADFTNDIDNPYWPMRPGSKWVYRGTEGGDEVRVEVTVTNDKKIVEGIEARVLLDEVTHANGELIERTYDWYAQDSDGNVWYLGEDTKEYEDGKVVSTGGSWQSGVDGAEAGIIVPGKPRVGLSYRQEYYEGEAEDRARVISVRASAEVPFGRFERMLKTEDTTPLEPNVVEHKYYARGIGLALKEAASGGGREELIEFTR